MSPFVNTFSDKKTENLVNASCFVLQRHSTHLKKITVHTSPPLVAAGNDKQFLEIEAADAF
jgi:hypothetical protein